MNDNNEEYIVAKEKAIRYIGISKKTKQEVINKLKVLKIEPLAINSIIKDLEELKYIDDKDYVRSYLIQNSRYLKYSKNEIRQKLLQKGINISIIKDEISRLLPEKYENEVIKKLLSGKLSKVDEIKRKEYLYRRGFENIKGEDIYE